MELQSSIISISSEEEEQQEEQTGVVTSAPITKSNLHFANNGFLQCALRTPNLVETNRRVYPCRFCNRKFYNSRSFGGHQNAHKHERIASMRGMQYNPLHQHHHPYYHHQHHPHNHYYSSLASLPPKGSCNRILGFQDHSKNSKTSSGDVHAAWFNTPINQSQAIAGSAKHDQSHVGVTARPASISGVARFGNGLTLGSSEGLAGYQWWTSGDGSRLNTSQDESQKLDLTLKL